MSGNILNEYIALLDRRKLSALWRAEQCGCGLKYAEGGIQSCIQALEQVLERMGLPCEGEDVNLDAISDLELALLCDCFGDDDFGAEPSPRLASFRFMRKFLFSRLSSHAPRYGKTDKTICKSSDERLQMLKDDDVAMFSMGRELMGEEFTPDELDYVMRQGGVKILTSLLEDGTLEDSKWSGRVADAFMSDYVSPDDFDMTAFMEKEATVGRAELWLKVLTSGFLSNGASCANPLLWKWDAAGFSVRDGYVCDISSEDDSRFVKFGITDAYSDCNGISKLECVKAYNAFREICRCSIGILAKDVAKQDSVFSSEFLIIDISSGAKSTFYPISGMETMPDDGWSDDYKSTKIVLRRIEPGTFKMGSPSTEIGRMGDEVMRDVTLTKPYYCGVFEITQRQWELVMGKNPASRAGGMHPVEKIAFSEIRGADGGARWPVADTVDRDSFIGRLRDRTGIEGLDIPTEAEWEYAARAGSEGAFTDGSNITSAIADVKLNEFGRYKGNKGAGAHAQVGEYKPNAWGLYDVLGNVFEWCLDRYSGVESSDSVTDPVGSSKGDLRVLKSGAWFYDARSSRLANRIGKRAAYSDPMTGLRLACR